MRRDRFWNCDLLFAIKYLQTSTPVTIGNFMISTAGLMPLHPGKLLDHEGLVTFCSSYAAMDTSFAEAKPIPIWVYGIIKVCLWLFMINFIKYIISPSFPQCNKKYPKAPLPVRKSSVSTNPDLFHLSSLLKAFPIPPVSKVLISRISSP